MTILMCHKTQFLLEICHILWPTHWMYHFLFNKNNIFIFELVVGTYIDFGKY